MDQHNPENKNSQRPDRFQSDTERIIHRHLSNKDDVITDDDIRNVRIGVTPTEQQVQNEGKQFDNETDAAADNGSTPGQTDDPITPWDIVQP